MLQTRLITTARAAVLMATAAILAGPAAAQVAASPDGSEPSGAAGTAGESAPTGTAAGDSERAREHYAAGEAAFLAGDFARAAEQYGLAYDLGKDPALLFKLASAHDRAGNCPAAVARYQQFLAEGGPDEQRQAEVRERIAACAAGAGGSATATQPTAPAAAGDAAAAAPSAAQPVGSIADPGAATDADADAAGTGSGADSAGTGSSADSAGIGAAGDAPPSFVGSDPSWQRSAAWTSVGLALALATTGGVLALSAGSREEDVQNLIDFRDPTSNLPAAFDGNTARRYRELVDEGEDLNTYATITFAAAGLVAAAAAVFFVLDATSTGGSAAASAQAGPADAAARTAPQLTPWAAPRAAGMAVGWQF
ncbi:MAG: hypothetical protein AAGC55_04215 [Myxococcota bacterium]